MTRRIFYLLLDGDVYEINLTTFETTKIVENMKPNCYVGSESGKYFAYLAENEAYDSRTINIYNMDTKESSQITCRGERAHPYARLYG